MKLSFVKNITTTKNSIFYSLIKYENQIFGFGRKHYSRGRIIKKVIFDDNFNIIEDNDIFLKGEDPRCFIYINKLYIQDNFFSNMYLIDYNEKKYIKIDITGKNISFIPYKDNLYFIHYIKPFELYRFDIKTKNIKKIKVEDDKNTYNYEYRGGTPGYKMSETEYYGFGHRTYKKNNIMYHDIFKWVVYFENDKLPRVYILDIEQPINSKKICDPTCVIEIKNKKYLITAESDSTWFRDQPYLTNVYEIIEDYSWWPVAWLCTNRRRCAIVIVALLSPICTLMLPRWVHASMVICFFIYFLCFVYL